MIWGYLRVGSAPGKDSLDKRPDSKATEVNLNTPINFNGLLDQAQKEKSPAEWTLNLETFFTMVSTWAPSIFYHFPWQAPPLFFVFVIFLSAVESGKSFQSLCVLGAVASTEVKQKLQEFLLSKSATKDSPTNGKNHSTSRHPKLWYTYVQC